MGNAATLLTVSVLGFAPLFLGTITILMSPIWIVILPFAGSLCAAFLPSHARNAAVWLAGAVALACVTLTFQLYPQVVSEGVVRAVLPWVPELGLNFTFRVDGFAWLFAMLVSVMGALVILYARYYMAVQDPVPRFFAFFLAFMGAMLGVVLSGNLIQLVVFWELTSLTSFMLIAYWYHRVDARRGARMALTVTAAGGLCLLAGMLILGHIVGSYDLDVVLASGDLIRADVWYLPALVLVALGALTKSAQFPFHFWLPHAMAAPTPVSVYLHSATMVKAGVFLLVRLWPVLAGTQAWFWIIGTSGLITLVLGAYAAIFQRDMKGVLAYSTISHLGLITLLLGLNSSLALIAAIFHIMNHATFKASLFMAAGMVDHETGTRDLTPAERVISRHAHHRDAGHGCGGIDGGRPAAERLSFKRNVLRGDGICQRPSGHAYWLASAGRDLGNIQRCVFVAFYLAGIFRTPCAGFTEKAARAAPLDAAAQRTACTGLPGGRHVSSRDHGTLPGYGGALRAGRIHAVL